MSSDTGSWGRDRGETLPDLLRAILAEDRRIERPRDAEEEKAHSTQEETVA